MPIKYSSVWIFSFNLISCFYYLYHTVELPCRRIHSFFYFFHCHRLCLLRLWFSSSSSAVAHFSSFLKIPIGSAREKAQAVDLNSFENWIDLVEWKFSLFYLQVCGYIFQKMPPGFINNDLVETHSKCAYVICYPTNVKSKSIRMEFFCSALNNSKCLNGEILLVLLPSFSLITLIADIKM